MANEVHRAKFKPDCFKSFPLHRAAASGSVTECKQLLADGTNPYQPTPDGWSALHAAIANRAESVVDLLLNQYEADWTIVRQTIQHQFLWKAEQTGWKSRPCLIAWTEEDCEQTVPLVASCPAGIPLSLQVFVLLRHPIHGHRFIALDVCNRTKWCAIMWLIQRLLPNGVLSLDRSDMRGDGAVNYLQLACTLSTKEIIVKLVGHGASLAVASGGLARTPFMAAGDSMRKDVIELLISRYSDRFDPFACDTNYYNLLHLMVQRQHIGMVECLVNFFLHYRTTKLRETKPVALSRILCYESKDCPSLHFWNFVRSSPMKKLCAKYIGECGMELHTRLADDTIVLAVLIARGIALEYCFEQIEQNLTLLEWQDHYSRLNILHLLIRWKQLTFVEALYSRHGALVKDLFELEEPDRDVPAYELLRQLLHNADGQGILFVVKHHRAFYLKDMEKLRQAVVIQHHSPNPSYDKALDVLGEKLPELREHIEANKKQQNIKESDFYDHLRSLCDSFKKTVLKLETDGKKLDDYLDSNGRTFLHVAASWGNKTLVERLLVRNMDVMALDDKGALPIHWVYRCESIFEMFLERNVPAQLAYVNPAGYNLLHICCKNGLHGDTLKVLLEHGMDVNGAAPDGQLPLSLASCCGTVSFLLEHGARIDLLNEELVTGSLRHMHYCAAIALIKRVADAPWFRKCAHIYLPWLVGDQSRHSFAWTSEEFLQKHPDIRRLLFDSLYEHSKDQMTELFARVCHRKMQSCVQWFMEYDYDIDYDYKHWNQSTPLLGLVGNIEDDVKEQLAVIERLLGKPIDVNATDAWGHNALTMFAYRFKWIRHCCGCELVLGIVSALLERGIKVDAQDSERGNTALHYAFEYGQWELVEFLIANGASVTIKNQAGKLASQMGNDMSSSLYGFIK
uniref:Uncharacterized protein n=1 Tax=Anopheles coluzzii TaxID=1518534 RepID=A0A6E8VLX4_ANOCL